MFGRKRLFLAENQPAVQGIEHHRFFSDSSVVGVCQLFQHAGSRCGCLRKDNSQFSHAKDRFQLQQLLVCDTFKIARVSFVAFLDGNGCVLFGNVASCERKDGSVAAGGKKCAMSFRDFVCFVLCSGQGGKLNNTSTSLCFPMICCPAVEQVDSVCF